MELRKENITNKLITILNIVLPWIIIFSLSMLSGYILLYKGYPKGDDTNFHYAQIEDIYLALKRNEYSVISSYIAHGLGYGKRLFYSPLSHFSMAAIGVILEPFGVSLLQAVKIVIFLSIFSSGMFAYKLGMRMTNNKALSIIIGATYLFMPYKLFCSFERFAIAEAVAISFVPLFFLGLYDFVHMKELKIKPFIEIIFGALFLYLSHNATALYSYAAGGIYLCFYFKNIYKSFKDKTTIIFTVATVIILLGLLSYFLFPTLELYNKNYYNVSYPERMWTYKQYLMDRTSTSMMYSGLLNFDFLNSTYPKYQLYNDIIFSTLFASLFIITSEIIKGIPIIKKYNKFTKYLYFIIPAIIYIFASFKVYNHVEAAHASIVLVGLYALYNIIPDINIKNNDNNKKKLLYDRTFIYSFLMLVITLLFIFIPDMWNMVIKPFYVIQFPFRLFFLVGMYFTLIVGSILKYFKNDKIIVSLTLISLSFMIVMTQANLEKRIESKKENPSFAYKITENDLTGNKHEIGFNFEYMPQCFYPGDSHEKSYDNSLFYSVRNIIHSDYYGHNVVNTLEPVFLEGSGTISNYSSKAPKISFNVEATTDSYIQVPLIYYPGYEITVINVDNNKEKEVEAKEVDGLVSFKLKEGNYKIKFNYKGTTIRKLSYAYFMFSILGLIIIYPAHLYCLYHKKKKEGINIFVK